MRLAPLGLALLLLAPAMAVGEPSLYERNRDLLLRTLPAGSVLEVQVVQDGQVVLQQWTAEQYAHVRAAHATAMGRDYGASFQYVPPFNGLGDQQYLGDIWTDHWGETVLKQVVPAGSPTSASMDKLFVYGGAGTSTGLAEHEAICYVDPFWIHMCTATTGWTYPQTSSEHHDAWFVFTGHLTIFPRPFGNIGTFDGALFAENI